MSTTPVEDATIVMMAGYVLSTEALVGSPEPEDVQHFLATLQSHVPDTYQVVIAGYTIHDYPEDIWSDYAIVIGVVLASAICGEMPARLVPGTFDSLIDYALSPAEQYQLLEQFSWIDASVLSAPPDAIMCLTHMHEPSADEHVHANRGGVYFGECLTWHQLSDIPEEPYSWQVQRGNMGNIYDNEMIVTHGVRGIIVPGEEMENLSPGTTNALIEYNEVFVVHRDPQVRQKAQKQYKQRAIKPDAAAYYLFAEYG